jgi:signal recognition particle subunit SEC65
MKNIIIFTNNVISAKQFRQVVKKAVRKVVKKAIVTIAKNLK